MLVLSRYRDESIYIGDDVIVTIVDIRGDRVRLGIQAPPNVSVHRQEIYDAILREKKGQGNDVASSSNEKSDKVQNSDKSRKEKKIVAPLEKQIEAQKSKGLPIDIDTPPIGFGGLSDIVS